MKNFITYSLAGLLIALVISPGLAQIQLPEIEPNKLVVKIKPVNEETLAIENSAKSLNIQEINSRVNTRSVKPLQFGSSNNYSRRISNPNSVLNNIYIIELDESEDVYEVIEQLSGLSNVVYAEPIYKEKILLTPDDSGIESQYSLALISAFDAWEVTQGDPSIIIAVSDTGADLDHSDLSDNLIFNENDPENGLDDDGNGYIDDVLGWDFADNDNDVSADFDEHGTQVAGVCSAVTNNDNGMAGIAYNSSFVPLKVFRSLNGSASNTYQSIIYAADQGYDVINLSWGSAGGFSQMNQDIINYAVLEKDMVVVAAAGNTNADLDFYPASYEHVLSVANTNGDDIKSPGATYSLKVDLTAPGFGIYSLKNGNSYANTSGSSFASPHVAGAAALVKSVFPDYNALQVMEQIRATADDIYDIPDNEPYIGRLGKGRLNLHRAVTDANAKSLRVEDVEFNNSFGNYAFFGDTVTLSLQFLNYLNPTTPSTTAILTSESESISIVNEVFEIGEVSELAVSDFAEAIILVSEDAEHDDEISLRLDYSDENYDDFELLQLNLSPPLLDLDNSNISMTISNLGELGYSSENNNSGIGFTWEGTRLAFNIGVAVGNHPDSISDNLMRLISSFTRDEDFQALERIKFYNNTIADRYTRSSFDDSRSGNATMDLIIEQEALSWTDEAENEFMILEYRITNNNNHEKQDMRFGFFSDWNLDFDGINRADWDEENELAYTYNTFEDIYAGIALLSTQNSNVYSIDLTNENGNEMELPDYSLDEDDKYNFMTTEKQTAGDLGNGNNVAQLLTAEIGNIEAYGSEKVAYALVVGNSLVELQQNVALAQEKYAEFLNNPPVIFEFGVCRGRTFTLDLPGTDNYELFDDLDMTNLIGTGNEIVIDGVNSDSVFYARTIDSELKGDLTQVKVIIDNPVTDFLIEPDTLYLGDNDINSVGFTDVSDGSISWSWNFDNGSSAVDVSSAVQVYNEVGVYEISMEVLTEEGCFDEVIKQLVVAERSELPIIENVVLCSGDQAEISASNTSRINVYTSSTSENPIFSGDVFLSGEILKDSIFYVASFEDTFESHLVEVIVDVDDPTVTFEVTADTDDLSSKNRISLKADDQSHSSYQWFVNDQLVGENANTTFDITSENSLEIELISTNALGCDARFVQQITISPGPVPEAESFTACEFDDVVISPPNGEVFYFYDDVSMTEAIFKGNALVIDDITAPITLYITNVDGFVESQAREIQIDIFPSEIEIAVDPELLILSENSSASFQYTASQIIANNIWSIDELYTDASNSPDFFFDEAGIYNIDLITTDTNGCMDTTSIAYQIINVPITGIDADIEEQIRIYPNPTSDLINLVFPASVSDMSIIDTSGKIIQRLEVSPNTSEMIVDLSLFKKGIYFLHGSYQRSSFSKKIIIID